MKYLKLTSLLCLFMVFFSDCTHQKQSETEENSKILFHSDRDGNLEIYVMDTAGSNQTRLTNNDLSDEAPHFSPDGTRIVSETGIDIGRERKRQIRVMNSDGSDLGTRRPW